MNTRRNLLKSGLAAGAALAISPRLAWAELAAEPLITRPIPRSGEQLPVVGLGTSASVAKAAADGETDKLRAVLQTLHEQGGRLIDTAPAYGGEAEKVVGEVARDAGLTNAFFWATKLNVAARGGTADPKAARAQLDTSLARIGKRPIDLVQVHNVGDPTTQLAILREYQQAGAIRHLGITTTFEGQYETLEQVMRSEPLDFIGVDYAVDNRHMEKRILPLARDKGIAVLIYAPFGRTRLWQTVRDQPLPDWAADFDARSWAQFFLKFVISHPAVTATTPATTRAEHMLDNLAAARGRLPDEAMRKRMIDWIEAL